MNSYWKRQVLMFYSVGKKNQKNHVEMASTPSPPPPLVRPWVKTSKHRQIVSTWYWTSMLWSIDRRVMGIHWPVSHACFAGSGVELIKVTCFFFLFSFFSSLLTSYGIQAIQAQIWPWLNVYINILLTIVFQFRCKHWNVKESFRWWKLTTNLNF